MKSLYAGRVNNSGNSTDVSTDLQAHWNQLAADVRHHRDLYYNSEPVISDAEFDRLFKALQDLEADHPELAKNGSPTEEVGAPVPTPPETSSAEVTFAPVRHIERLYSLDNVFSKSELLEWLHRTPAPTYLTELKIDGLSIDLVYRDGELVSAAKTSPRTPGRSRISRKRFLRRTSIPCPSWWKCAAKCSLVSKNSL